jgi:putative ABC transport system ATP-binding protein
MPLIELKEIIKTYSIGESTVSALRGVNLSIGRGEFVAVWGPSGSGKTTLLNLIGAIDDPTSGQLFFDGNEVISLSDNQKAELRNTSIGHIFQQFNLVPVLTALENVMLPLHISGLSASKAREAALFRLHQVELTEFILHRPDKLSGGQQQRVAIARALVTNPSLVIADEPTANLDSKTAMKIVSLMRDLNQKENTTFVFSTHDQRLLEKVYRLIHLEDGMVVEE